MLSRRLYPRRPTYLEMKRPWIKRSEIGRGIEKFMWDREIWANRNEGSAYSEMKRPWKWNDLEYEGKHKFLWDREIWGNRGSDSNMIYSNKSYVGGKMNLDVNYVNSELFPTRGITWYNSLLAVEGLNKKSSNSNTKNRDWRWLIKWNLC